MVSRKSCRAIVGSVSEYHVEHNRYLLAVPSTLHSFCTVPMAMI